MITTTQGHQEQEKSEKLSQGRGDMTTKYNVALWMRLWNRKIIVGKN